MTYEEHHASLVAYLNAKVESQDWHAVSDAANDLRVLEAARAYDNELKACRSLLADMVATAPQHAPNRASIRAAADWLANWNGERL